MSRIEYKRQDTRLGIEAIGPARVRLELRPADGAPFWRGEWNLGSGAPGGLHDAVVAHAQPADPWGPIRRLALDARGPELNAHPWELWSTTLFDLGPHFDSIVRLSPVWARVSQVTFTVPMRVLLCDAQDPQPLLQEIRAVFGSVGIERDARVALAYVGAALPLRELSDPASTPKGWPVVDVIHLMSFPVADSPEMDLSPYAGDWGSLGWLVQRLNAWQTRLVIINVAGPGQAARARRLASALVDRGGPAVLVRSAAEPIRPLYDRLIHDMPLDAFSSAKHQYSPQPLPTIDSLFVGGGREELTRVSATAEAMRGVRRDLILGWRSSRARTPDGRRLYLGVRPGLADILSSHPAGRLALRNAVRGYANWRYNLSESDGLIPMAESLEAVRSAVGSLQDTSRLQPRDEAPRHVNGSLWWEERGVPRRVDARTEILRVGQPCLFGLQIGRLDREIPVYEASAFLEIPRVAGKRGVWLEVAVNGVGFEVRGAAVQDLWLPFDEPTDQLWFSVVPNRPGAAVLRYTIYHRQNVVQSFRLAALTSGAETWLWRKLMGQLKPFPRAAPNGAAETVSTATTPRQRRLLARALHVPVDRLPEGTYVTRLEYEAAPIERAASLVERRVSLVANDIDGTRVITVKGRRYFFDSKPGRIDPTIDRAREVFFEGSVDKNGQPQPSNWTSRFGVNEGINLQNLRELLPRMALAGWQMYDRVFSADDRDQMQADLSEVDAKIDVAHVLIDEVVPWAAMYDRRFTDKPKAGGTIEVCTAALPTRTGELTVSQCGDAASCVLHRGVAPENVACPLHFWGFRHQIEIPAKQAGTRSVGPATRVDVGPQPPPATPALQGPPAAPPRLVAVLNSALVTTSTHANGLQSLKSLDGRAAWAPLETDSHRLLTALADLDLDVLYLYCHARGGIHDPERIDPPVVEFGAAESLQRYAAAEIDARWRNQPLVIINGCATAALSPDALSPFVLKFIRDCKAGAVIGTEIPLHERVAADAAERLLERIVAGEAVGPALLSVRRELLAIGNPLGLAYTLFGTIEHAIRKAGERGVGETR